jgi:hypothetical protein
MTPIRHNPRFRKVGDSTWPTPGDGEADDEVSLEWVLRYAPERLTRGDQLHLASIVAAYRELLTCTSRRRAEVVRSLRASLQHSGEQT